MVMFDLTMLTLSVIIAIIGEITFRDVDFHVVLSRSEHLFSIQIPMLNQPGNFVYNYKILEKKN